METAAKLCNLDTLSIALFKLQGHPPQPAHFLESKEVSSGNQLDWHSLKKHLTTNYLEIPYDTHAINAYDNLHQGNDESTSTYLHRAQDILENIHHTSDMTSIPAISTNHAKILTGLKDSRLRNKLAKSKARKWTTMSQVLQDVAEMAIDLKGHMGNLYLHSKFNMFHSHILVLLTGPTGQLQKVHNNHWLDKKSPNVGIAKENITKRTVQQSPSKTLHTKSKSTKEKQQLNKNLFIKSFRIEDR